MSSMKNIAVIDFGGQYTHLIANGIRNLGVYCEIYKPDGFDPLRHPDVVGLIFSGGPHSVTEPGHPTIRFDPAKAGLPILGLCYGHQLLAQLSGGRVSAGKTREFGPATIECKPSSRLFAGLPERQRVWMSHGDHVETLPPGFLVTASSDDLPIAAFESPNGKYFGVQFHPEVTHTTYGTAILEKFVSVCTDERNWMPSDARRTIVERIRLEAGNRRLLLLLSGGVDSLVALALCIEAVGPDRVHSLHIDTGFMRQGESQEIVDHLAGQGFRNIEAIDASDLFFGRLAGVCAPEQKREIIGRTFVDVMRQKLSEYSAEDDLMFVQGTIYPDRIESGSGTSSAKIKTHHNRVPEIKRMIEQGRILEPIKDLYKNEIRALGRELGLPDFLLQRHPFPGPGLAIRLLASDSATPEPGFDAEHAALSRIAGECGFDAVILPVRSVGVQGDGRTFLHPAAIWYNGPSFPDWDAIAECANRIVNALRTVNRVVFSPRKPVHRTKLIEAALSRDRADALRHVDHLATRFVADMPDVWQMPVVSLPLLDESGKPLFVIRPVTSENAMTADFFRMDPGQLTQLTSQIERLDDAGTLLYDVTPKPPATIEWE